MLLYLLPKYWIFPLVQYARKLTIEDIHFIKCERGAGIVEEGGH